ncbi:hypothetical protein [Allorhodopirellula heiligendammensis]|uniref:Uncharacterized protein n=1 Tax=Allorhodopirellula heiligendammensis TaxID=2714739 RepID=A0A5C6BTQ0_9BACT|nr:hypothetical protein [Allorhodopirellula heiligendammensis]TWU15047.1 hypothetical protein Poly21_22380 [Allorhodopirellula heiligendammensis]
MEPEVAETGYLYIDKIDFRAITELFSNLHLFDDVYLNMQGINVGLIDTIITDLEYKLLAEYIENERTPLQSCMIVSAMSQMWVFAVYELLRTWRGRILKLRTLKENGGLNAYIAKYSTEGAGAAEHYRASHAKRMRDDATFVIELHAQLRALEPTIAIADTIRVNLAKHETPGKNNSVPRMPGYGRIDRNCGAMNYEVALKGGNYTLLNRRDIAEMLRATTLPTRRRT